MKIRNPFRLLVPFDWALWLFSLTAITASTLILGGDILPMLASLIGVTALIFLAKGAVLGQVLIVAFAVFYGIISFAARYYGEMITYLGMSAPIALFSIFSWMRHPYKESAQVEVHRMSKKEYGVMTVLAVSVTAAFYFILKALGNAALLTSTLSVTTSFCAAFMSFRRSPYYALGYTANDIVLIVLWSINTAKDISGLSMVICFSLFLFHDLYGFISWKRMQRLQQSA